MPDPAEHLSELIDELHDVLAEERRALLSGTADAINAATQRMVLVAEAIERAIAVPGALRPHPASLIPLMRYNQENAFICDAMLRHLVAALDKLRRQDPHRSYGSDGSEQSRSAHHALGAA